MPPPTRFVICDAIELVAAEKSVVVVSYRKPEATVPPSASNCALTESCRPLLPASFSPQRDDIADSVVQHQCDNRLSFEHVVWTKAKDVISGNGERGSRAALADDEDVVRVRIGLNHGNLRTRLRPDNDLCAASVEVLDRFKRL